MTTARILECAQGYLELGMYESVLEELALLPSAEFQRPPVLQLRLQAHMQLKQWKSATIVGKQLCATDPQLPASFIHTAYCLHETGQTEAALTTLQSGPKTLTTDPTYHYNLACYCAMLGRNSEAQQHLDHSFSIDATFRAIARKDPDLQSLQDRL